MDTSRKLLSAVGALYSRYAVAALARPGRAALLLFLLCIPAAILDAQFFGRVRTGLQDLLPSDAQSVRSLDEIHRRLGGQSHLTVIAQSPDSDANRAFIKDLAQALSARRLPVARSIQWNVDSERHWIADHGALLMPRADFDELAGVLDEEVHAQKQSHNPLAFDLGDTSSSAVPAKASLRERWEQVAGRLTAKSKAEDRFPTGYLETPDGHTVVLLIWLQGSELELGPALGLEKAVDAEVAPLRLRYPAVKVAYNGEVPNLIEEHQAILADLSLSSLLVFLLVGALIVFYFRSVRAVLAVVFALLPGLAFTFAIGRLTVGSLNSNTAFLGSIIAGNGINYPLLLLAYFRINPDSLDRTRSYLLAARNALPGTFGAAATASAAYGGLAAAHFRGFSEFGWIGGLGMITTWLLTFMAMPIAIGLFRPPQHPKGETRQEVFAARFYASRRAPRFAAALFVVAAIALSVAGIHKASKGGLYEMNINALRNRQSLLTGAASWDKKMNELFGVWLNPVVALVRNPAERELAAAALRSELLTGSPAPAERVETIESVVPSEEEQLRRLTILRRAQRLLTGVAPGELPASAKSYMDRWLAASNLKEITAADVPPTLTQAFTELPEFGGRSDQVVLVYPSLKIDYNDARNVLRFSDALHRAVLPAGSVAGGGFLFMAEIIRLVQGEVPVVVLVVCLLVAIALIPIFLHRARRIPASVATIAAVALAAQSIMLAFGVRVNMFNFAAIPITIGVGSDYIVNLFGAMDAFETDARQAAARMGGAILLCSLTTVVGYLSLVFAQSGALRTFGWAAVLGEIMAVTTVLLVVPALARPRRLALVPVQRAA